MYYLSQFALGLLSLETEKELVDLRSQHHLCLWEGPCFPAADGKQMFVKCLLL